MLLAIWFAAEEHEEILRRAKIRGCAPNELLVDALRSVSGNSSEIQPLHLVIELDPEPSATK